MQRVKVCNDISDFFPRFYFVLFIYSTVNNKSVKVINGELVAIPFATSKSSVPKETVASQYGK